MVARESRNNKRTLYLVAYSVGDSDKACHSESPSASARFLRRANTGSPRSRLLASWGGNRPEESAPLPLHFKNMITLQRNEEGESALHDQRSTIKQAPQSDTRHLGGACLEQTADPKTEYRRL